MENSSGVFRYFVQRVAGTIGAFGSLVVLIFSFRPAHTKLTPVEKVSLGLFVVFGIVAVAGDIKDYRLRRPRTFRSKRRAHRFWLSRIRSAGRVVIVTRDMTWVDTEMRTLLKDKAARGELTVVLPARIALSDALEAVGAEIMVYATHGYTIRSRFIALNAEQNGATMLLGGERGGREVVHEIGVSDYPAFGLAEDLWQVLVRVTT